MNPRRLNVYVCRAGHWFTSEDLDEGVTPFAMPCRCGGDAFSCFYRWPETMPPLLANEQADITWRKAWKRVRPSMRDHVKGGGLCFEVTGALALHLKQFESLQWEAEA